MSQDNPKVSVIIPVYNTEKYLQECLDSVVNQTLKDIEIICVDDGSTDGSVSIISEYAARDSRVKPIYYTITSSASQARKDGVMLSRGKYIMFMDSDDTLDLQACEELSAEMDLRDVDILQFGTYIDAMPHVASASVDFMTRFTTPYTHRLEGSDVFRFCFIEAYARKRLRIYQMDSFPRRRISMRISSLPGMPSRSMASQRSIIIIITAGVLPAVAGKSRCRLFCDTAHSTVLRKSAVIF